MVGCGGAWPRRCASARPAHPHTQHSPAVQVIQRQVQPHQALQAGQGGGKGAGQAVGGQGQGGDPAGGVARARRRAAHARAVLQRRLQGGARPRPRTALLDHVLQRRPVARVQGGGGLPKLGHHLERRFVAKAVHVHCPRPAGGGAHLGGGVGDDVPAAGLGGIGGRAGVGGGGPRRRRPAVFGRGFLFERGGARGLRAGARGPAGPVTGRP